MREFQANKLLEVTNVDASHSTFNNVGRDQTNQNLTDCRTYSSIVMNIVPRSDRTIILMMVCIGIGCIGIGIGIGLALR